MCVCVNRYVYTCVCDCRCIDSRYTLLTCRCSS